MEEIGYNRKDFRENLYLSVFLKNFMFSPCINDIQILYYPTNAQYIVLSVRMEDIGYNRKDFRENLYLSVFHKRNFVLHRASMTFRYFIIQLVHSI